MSSVMFIGIPKCQFSCHISELWLRPYRKAKTHEAPHTHQLESFSALWVWAHSPLQI